MVEHDNSWEALLEPGRADEFFTVVPLPEFVAGAGGFSPVDAWWLAEISRLVYRDRDRERFWTRVGLEELCFFDRGGTQCAVLDSRAGEFSIVAFRGTNEIRDWLMNARITPEDWRRGGKVHGGFRRAFDNVWDLLQEELAGLDGPMFYTGHSLGGALATLLASEHPPDAVYTFGGPRVGDSAFVESVAGVPIHRVVNRHDVVPTLPPAVDLLGFRHAGDLRRIDGAEDVQHASETPGLTAIRAATDLRRWFRPAPFLADHAPVNYVASLERLL